MPQTVPHHKIFWHRMREDRDCGKTLALVAMHIAADGSFLLEWFCMGCKEKNPRQYWFVPAMCHAYEADMMSAEAARPRPELP